MKTNPLTHRLLDFLNWTGPAVEDHAAKARGVLSKCAEDLIAYHRAQADARHLSQDQVKLAKWEHEAQGRLFARLKRRLRQITDGCLIRFNPFSLRVSTHEGKIETAHIVHAELPFLILPEYGYHAVRFVQLAESALAPQLMKCEQCGRFAIGQRLSSGPQRFCPKPADCSKRFDNALKAKQRIRVFRLEQDMKEKAAALRDFLKELNKYPNDPRARYSKKEALEDWSERYHRRKRFCFGSAEEYERACQDLRDHGVKGAAELWVRATLERERQIAELENEKKTLEAIEHLRKAGVDPANFGGVKSGGEFSGKAGELRGNARMIYKHENPRG
jgi:hypothetical protein